MNKIYNITKLFSKFRPDSFRFYEIGFVIEIITSFFCFVKITFLTLILPLNISDSLHKVFYKFKATSYNYGLIDEKNELRYTNFRKVSLLIPVYENKPGDGGEFLKNEY